MMRVLLLGFVLFSCASAATVETWVSCYNGQLPPGHYGAGGTYSAYCEAPYFVPSRSIPPGPGYWSSEIESASIIFGSKVEVDTWSQSGTSFYYAGGANAKFSATYVFTLTGGDNLFDFGPSYGLGALAVPCLTVVKQAGFTLDTYATVLGPSYGYGLYLPGDVCATSTTNGQPVLLNVPITLQLTLTAYSTVNYGGSGSASAAFDGFRFFKPGVGPIDATYTFTLNDQLPANLPEPGSFAMMAAAAGLWLIFRRRLPV